MVSLAAFFLLFVLSTGLSSFTIQVAGPEFLQTVLETWWLPYLDVDPLVSFNYSTKSNFDVLHPFETASHALDIGIIDPYDHISDASWTNPNFLLFPILVDTLVPMVNVIGLGHSSLVLTRQTLAEIFLGNITNWNDVRIKQTNQDSILPDANITVFYLKNDTHNSLWSEALSVFSSEWNETYGNFIVWPTPLQQLPNFVGLNSDIEIQAKVTLTPNSISYLSPSRTTRVNLPYARLINKHGEIVGVSAESGSESDSVADVEVDSNFKAAHGIDSPVSNAWPLGSYIHFVVSKQYDKNSCKRTREIFLWFHWLLDTTLPRRLAAVDGYGFLNKEIHDRVDAALRDIQCNNISVLAYEDHEPYEQHLNTFLGLTIVFLTASLLVASAHIWSFRASKINLIYSSVFLVGIILTLSSPIFWYLPATSNAICQARIWTVSLGFAILLGTMFSRTWQLREIYLLQKKTFDQIKHNVSIKSSLMKLAITISVLLIIDIFLLSLWTAIDPYVSKFIVRDEYNLYGDWSCSSNHLKYWLSLQVVYMFFLIGFGIYVIYQTWSFQKKVLVVETRWVLLALYNIILNMMALAPFLSIHTPLEGFLCLLVIISIDFSATGIICAVLLPRLVENLEWSKSSEHKKGATTEDNTTGNVKTLPHRNSKHSSKGSNKKKIGKKEYSRTPEDCLADRLQNPQPLKIDVRKSNKFKIVPAPTTSENVDYTSPSPIYESTNERPSPLRQPHDGRRSPSPIRDSQLEPSISVRLNLPGKPEQITELTRLASLDMSSTGVETDPLTGDKMTWSANPIQEE